MRDLFVGRGFIRGRWVPSRLAATAAVGVFLAMIALLAAPGLAAGATPGASSATQPGEEASGPADLTLTMTAPRQLVTLAGQVPLTVTLSNEGSGRATGVAVQAGLPAGLSFISATAGAGSYDGASGVWAVGSLAASTAVSLRLVARAEVAGVVTSVATIAHPDQLDPDSANNSARVSILIGHVRSVDPATWGSPRR